MKHIEVNEETHDLIKFYCWYHKIKVKEFVNSKLQQLPELKEFKSKRKKIGVS